jgi:hypothetical protein
MAILGGFALAGGTDFAGEPRPTSGDVVAPGQKEPAATGRTASRNDTDSRAGTASVINAKGYTSSRICGTCHVDIYSSWKNSLHAFSLSDPVFDAAYMQAIKESGEEARRLCLRCHAPLTIVNEDYDLSEGVTREGVTCDFCHTITEVHLDNPETPFSVDVGLVKRSVLRRASSPVHDVAYSELHESSDLCGGCHDYESPNGTLIMSTYDEWKRGPYAPEGIQCQNCHMARTVGKVVSPDVKVTEAEHIHLHNLIRDADQLRSALAVRIINVERMNWGISVEVLVENVGSGHMVPTGIPSREIVLTVAVHDGERTETRKRRYRKVIADKDDRVLTRDFELMLRGRKIVSDNRIRPREQRIEWFSFPSPGSGKLKVRAAVTYEYAPMVLDQREINIELGTAERFVR